MVIAGVVFTSLDVDPLGYIIELLAPTLSKNIIAYVIRYITAIEVFEYILMSARTVGAVAILGDVLRCEIVDQLQNLPVSAQQLRSYRQLQVVSLLTVPFEELGSAQVLLSEGALVALGVPFMFLCFKKLGCSYGILVLIAVSVSFIVIQIIFSLCGAVYKKTQMLLSRWNKQAKLSNGYKKLYLTKYLKGVGPTSIPVGNVGVFDDEVRTNYTQKLQAYCIDITIAFSEFAN